MCLQLQNNYHFSSKETIFLYLFRNNSNRMNKKSEKNYLKEIYVTFASIAFFIKYQQPKIVPIYWPINRVFFRIPLVTIEVEFMEHIDKEG